MNMNMRTSTRTRTIILWSGGVFFIVAGIVTLFLSFGGTKNIDANDVNVVYTNAAATVAAQQQTLQAATMTPTVSLATVTAPALASPTFQLLTPVLLPTTKPVIVTACDVAVYVSDVTIPDGTTIPAGKSFTKTWKVSNTGACAWTATYQLVFVSGDSLGGKATPIGVVVNPGEFADISVVLTSSSAAGDIKGTWRLSNDKAVTFGDGLTVVINSGTAATSTLDPAQITPTDPIATETPTETLIP